jgi:hypothetical protein
MFFERPDAAGLVRADRTQSGARHQLCGPLIARESLRGSESDLAWEILLL